MKCEEIPIATDHGDYRVTSGAGSIRRRNENPGHEIELSIEYYGRAGYKLKIIIGCYKTWA